VSGQALTRHSGQTAVKPLSGCYIVRADLTNPHATTSHQWRRLARWWRLGIILICAAASLWAIFHLTTRNLERQVIWTDYAIFHAAVNRWLDGLPMYGRAIPMFGAPTITESSNFNPPQFHLLVWPFARLALRPGLLLWQALSILAGLLSAAIVVRTLRPGWSAMPAMLAAAVLLNSAALSSTLWFGQMSLFLAVPVTLAWRARGLGRWREVAGWIGIAASVKPFLLIVFPYLFTRTPVARRVVGRHPVGDELRGGCGGVRPGRAGAVVRSGAVADLGDTFPQRLLPGIRDASDGGVAR
jgi:hypothetical protein